MKSGVEWRAWGKTDPLFGVATWPGKRKSDPHPWTDDEFMATGESEWAEYRDFWERYGVSRESCAEIGCGAGRMTRQLARYFGSVHGIDISEDMIAYARRLVDEPNVQFHVNDGISLPLGNAAVTAVFSTFVFQHFDDLAAAARIFHEIHRILADDGTMAIQLPVYLWPRPERLFGAMLSLETFLVQRYAAFWRWRLRRGKGKPVVTYLAYDIDWLTTTLSAMGFAEVTIRIICRGGQDHACLFARKRRSGEPRGGASPDHAATVVGLVG